ncbi:GntR family transcriptional regulator [Aneurinibacillus terranovensis]|uniref:GntR family transcriptional regulator n=1 Tax=Aneurinibacillus terranovensis TaxID=278991 RepID=UPI00041B0CCF|nr:GntR family transcriptional regulator [Aneurinibacillus terranovensis]
MINNNSPIPKYIQIANHLRLIANEFGNEGKQKFLTDDELIKMFGVSRMTIRQAVQVLVEEGLLTREQGKGTFIAKREKLETDIEKLDTFFKGWYFKNFRVQLLCRGIVSCPENIATKLGIKPGEEVVQIKRLRLSENLPIVIDNRYLLKTFGEQITDEELTSYSFSHIFLRKFNLVFSEGQLEIEAILANEEISTVLGVPVGSPILYRNSELKVESYGCVLAGDSCYRGDKYKYKSFLHAD